MPAVDIAEAPVKELLPTLGSLSSLSDPQVPTPAQGEGSGARNVSTLDAASSALCCWQVDVAKLASHPGSWRLPRR